MIISNLLSSYGRCSLSPTVNFAEFFNFVLAFFNIFSDIKSLNQVRKIVSGEFKSINSARKINKNPYVMIHSHSPIGGVIGRIVSKEYGLISIYTAHGFHFYKGGSILNWILFYPIEKIFSSLTDILITINQEDYNLAKNKFSAKSIYRIPGIGIDLDKFILNEFDVAAYRKKLGIKTDDYMILSVGELNDNKNQELIIKTIAEMKDPSIHYFIAGVGKNKDVYEKLSIMLKVSNQVHLLGFRTDIPELNHCADVFAFPSIREGLGMASLEALASGTPVCGMNTRGINEYVVDGKTGYLFENNVESCKNALVRVRGKKPEMREACLQMAQKYSFEETNKIMESIYK